jgi:phage shock protein PspC (stress-responsive transcriptional regulator)
VQTLMQSSRQLWRSYAGTIAGFRAGLAAYLGVNAIAKRTVMMSLELLNGLGLLAYFDLFLIIPDSWKCPNVALE